MAYYRAAKRRFEASLLGSEAELVGTPVWVNHKGEELTVTWEDVLAVAPCNAQVGEIHRLLPLARVGTVDKFQGQEAPISIYSMTTSAPEEAPHANHALSCRR